MKHQQTDTANSAAGFTLIEVLIVVAIIGILGSIMAPSWFSFLERNRLTTGRDQIHSAIRQAQMTAQRRGLTWQFSIREQNDFVEWAVHRKPAEPDKVQWQDEVRWEVLDSKSIQIDTTNKETTFADSGDVYYVRFDEDGNAERLGRITLSSEQVPTIKRCVIVSTLIGATRKSKEQPVPNEDEKTCY